MEKIRLQKLLFLFTQHQEKPAYYFLPHKYGCYSFQAAEDARILTEYYRLLTKDEKSYVLNNKKIKKAISLKKEDEKSLDLIFNKYGRLPTNKVIYEVYKEYPYYAVNSELLNKAKFKPLSARINKEKTRIRNKGISLYTIGYEGKSIDQYMKLLIDNNISVLVDVRHNPFSMKWGFSKKQLQDKTSECGIDYVHIPELGIEGNLRKDIRSRSDYNRLFARYRRTLSQIHKVKAIQCIQDLLTKRPKHSVALTCFEKEHTSCHRNFVAEAVASRCKVSVEHI